MVAARDFKGISEGDKHMIAL